MLDSPRKVFAERFPAFVEPWARMTIRHGEQLTSIGLATCGKGGTRLAARLGVQTTRQTTLRRIMDLPDSSPGVILFLGIDDFSGHPWEPLRHHSGQPGEQAGGGPLT